MLHRIPRIGSEAVRYSAGIDKSTVQTLGSKIRVNLCFPSRWRATEHLLPIKLQYQPEPLMQAMKALRALWTEP